MGYKLYYKSGHKERAEQYESKTYATQSAAELAQKRYKQKFGYIWKQDKGSVMVRKVQPKTSQRRARPLIRPMKWF